MKNVSRLLASLLLATASFGWSFAEDVRTPLTITDERGVEESYYAPFEEWRRTAVERLSLQSDDPLLAVSDMAFFVSGREIEVGERRPGMEFLRALDDARVAGMLRVPRKKLPGFEGAMAKLSVAREILARETMADMHAEAAVDEIRWSIVEARTPTQLTANFQEAAQRHAGIDNVSEVASSCLRAVTRPETKEDFANARELHEIAIDGTRGAGIWASMPTIMRLEKEGVAILDPAHFEGDEQPIRDGARLAFDMHRTTLLNEIAELARQSAVTEEGMQEIRYWQALSYHAIGEYDTAIPIYENLVAEGNNEYWALNAYIRLGQSYMQTRRWLEAAVTYSDILALVEGIEEHEAKAIEARKSVDFVMRFGLVDRLQLDASLQQKMQNRTVSMNIK